jgi:hypothetical protein
MGRSFVSIRQGVNGMTGRWARFLRALGTEDRPHAEQLVTSAKKHSSEAFYGCDDPLEAAVFSALVEIARRQAELPRDGERPDVDP